VNAPIIARERGIAISEMRSSVSSDYVNLVAVSAETDNGESPSRERWSANATTSA
jgi:hypothetical protein